MTLGSDEQMRISRTAATTIAVAVGVGVGAAGDAAHALDLRDRVISITPQYTRDLRDLSTGWSRHSGPERWVDVYFNLVAGKIVSVGYWRSGCELSFVYTPGRPSGGTIECKPKRIGTSSNWTETIATATFRTQSAVAGDVLTIKDEMKGTDQFDLNHCGIRGSIKTVFAISESLKVQISGDHCQVLDYRRVIQEEATSDGSQHEVKREVWTPLSAASCKIERRSEKPLPKMVETGRVSC